MPEPIRSFIAFDITSEEILKRLSEAQEKLVKTGADFKLVKPENIHITMRFLGNIQPNMVDRIHSEMEKVAFTPFDVEIRGIGAFPNLKYTRVVWAGIQKGAEKLEDIFNQLEPRLQELGFRPDKKGFSLHITIARIRTGRNKAELIRCVNELTSYEFGILKVNCLKLKKSVLTPKGPIYSTLKEVCREK
ncbi:MAG: RNA 2',3'-cyclic phosphodiesterase [Candidatus Bathyarchaeota archaeon]|nr:RNA 2',3'-cyclic phosphodiesterase [Candidatus Bathyarchaeota archaeon]MDH5494135.1 RNA 2',3'-cyclic phosphodiesterase [Candidatus Bathyarchaeota archaeon]